jgi:hypothetical protein
LVFGVGLGVGLGVGFGADTTFGEGEQIDSTHRSAASAERGMLAIWEALGQLACATTGLAVAVLAGLADVFGAGLGVAFGLGATGTVTVLVMVCVLVDPAEELEEPTHTVTEPDPILEPWLRPELEEPPPEHAVAIWESKPTRATATKILAKPKLAC